MPATSLIGRPRPRPRAGNTPYHHDAVHGLATRNSGLPPARKRTVRHRPSPRRKPVAPAQRANAIADNEMSNGSQQMEESLEWPLKWTPPHSQGRTQRNGPQGRNCSHGRDALLDARARRSAASQLCSFRQWPTDRDPVALALGALRGPHIYGLALDGADGVASRENVAAEPTSPWA